MRRLAWIGGLGVLASAVAVPGASPAEAPATADQVLVAELEGAASAARSALRRLSQPSTSGSVKAVADLRRAATGVASAAGVAPRAVGALDVPSVRLALGRTRTLSRRAAADARAGRYAAARSRIQEAIALKRAALRDFGTPLAKEFPAFAVNRDFENVRGFAGYSGLTATAGAEVVHMVIGAADRVTANVGEVRQVARVTGEALPITQMSVFIIRDPIGRFTSNWCALADGLITCDLRPTLRPGYTYTIAFGPKLAPGTRLLVKFTAADGRRSYAVFRTR